MRCLHRFHHKLIPDWPVEYLFVGTFNPEWSGENDAVYFYGRPQNRFWEIMPLVLRLPNQIENRDKPELLENFLKDNKIGLTDLILALENADENNPTHRKSVLSFKDDELLHFKIIFNERIFNLIEKNLFSLRNGGVFLTRKTTPPANIGLFWKKIVQFCNSKSLKSSRLISPSLRVGKKSSKMKISEWKTAINES